ncbi:MAG: ChaN family lipoprotein [Alphaproteobacteria bacterium]|nr:ChaN family lipoprotein [Alphaproteobacteria bacterium]
MKYIICILLFILPTPLFAASKIWDVAQEKYISEKTLIKKLGNKPHILMAIGNDNASHHKLAARLIEKLDISGKTPVILLGNVERDKQNAFAIFRKRNKVAEQPYDATGLDMLLDWRRSGQPDWAIARPLFDMAIRKEYALMASRLSRYEVGQIQLDGIKGVPEDIAEKLRPILSEPLPEKIKDEFSAEINKEYCNSLPPKAVARQILIRRTQNGLFALNMIKAKQKTAFLITERKYMGKNTGIARSLAKLTEKSTPISLLFTEGQPTNAQVDFIWQTKGPPRTDPCQLLKR